MIEMAWFTLMMTAAPKYIVLYLGVLFTLAIIDKVLFNEFINNNIGSLDIFLMITVIGIPVCYTVMYLIVKCVEITSFTNGAIIIQF